MADKDINNKFVTNIQSFPGLLSRGSDKASMSKHGECIAIGYTVGVCPIGSTSLLPGNSD